MKNTDVVIIGAGPVGLFAGFYAGMRGLSAIVVDQLEMPGGQLAALYPEKNIYDVAGINEIKAQDLVNNLLEQMSRFEETTELLLNNSVKVIEKLEDGNFIVKTDKEEINTKTIIVAAGNGAFAPRKLGLENEEEFDNIHYFVNDMDVFSGKKVAIFGGGDSAVDWGLALSENATSVNVIHRRNEFRAHDHTVEELKKSSAIINTPFVPKELIGSNGKVTKVIIEDTGSKELTEIEVDDVICTFGFVSNIGPINDWGLEIENNKIKVDSMQKTNVDGIFAIGDICTYDGKASLIINGFGEGPVAINSAYKKIFPDAIIGALHSSSSIGGK